MNIQLGILCEMTKAPCGYEGFLDIKCSLFIDFFIHNILCG